MTVVLSKTSIVGIHVDSSVMRTLANSEWVRQHQNLVFIGPTGIGEAGLGCALA